MLQLNQFGSCWKWQDPSCPTLPWGRVLRSVGGISRVKTPSSSKFFAQGEDAPVSSTQAVQMTIKEINRNETAKGWPFSFRQALCLLSPLPSWRIGFIVLLAAGQPLCWTVTDFGWGESADHTGGGWASTLPSLCQHLQQRNSLCSIRTTRAGPPLDALSCWWQLVGLHGKCLACLQAGECSASSSSAKRAGNYWTWVLAFLSAFLPSFIGTSNNFLQSNKFGI